MFIWGLFVKWKYVLFSFPTIRIPDASHSIFALLAHSNYLGVFRDESWHDCSFRVLWHFKIWKTPDLTERAAESFVGGSEKPTNGTVPCSKTSRRFVGTIHQPSPAAWRALQGRRPSTTLWNNGLKQPSRQNGSWLPLDSRAYLVNIFLPSYELVIPL